MNKILIKPDVAKYFINFCLLRFEKSTIVQYLISILVFLLFLCFDAHLCLDTYFLSTFFGLLYSFCAGLPWMTSSSSWCKWTSIISTTMRVLRRPHSTNTSVKIFMSSDLNNQRSILQYVSIRPTKFEFLRLLYCIANRLFLWLFSQNLDLSS